MTAYGMIEQKLTDFLGRQKTAKTLPATGVTKETYLDIIAGIVGFFQGHQEESGCIIDPVIGGERQYSTPSYAAAAACLVKNRGRKDLLDSASRALTFSLESMVAGRCNNHGNFYTTMVVHAFLWLQDLVEPQQVVTWKGLYGNIDRDVCYKQAFHNWSVVAEAGESMRLQYGLGGNIKDIDESMELQLPLITELGMYVDPNGPLAYDFFSRLFFRMMLNHGYDGQHRAVLLEASERGAITSLFMQSPTGEILLGGRSAQHQWNEAEQCYVFETYANEYAQQGNMALAGVFKRAAKLSLASVTRWIRPSGELNIVRNWYDPSERVGYEGYSFHSQYNLLAAFMLAGCYELANEDIAEKACPAEEGGFVLPIVPHFHKVIANAGGYYVVIQTKGEKNYNPTGIIRIQKRGLNLPLGPADMAPLGKAKEGEGGAIAYAFSTFYREKWQRLADLTKGELDEVKVEVTEERPDRCVVRLQYIGGLSVNLFQRTLIVEPHGITVEDEASMNFYEEIPIMLFDGREETTVNLQSRQASVQLRDEVMSVTLLGAEDGDLELTERTGQSRNGKLGCLRYATKGRKTAYRITLEKV
jgi:hypothetical protein